MEWKGSAGEEPLTVQSLKLFGHAENSKRTREDLEKFLGCWMLNEMKFSKKWTFSG